MDKEFKGVYPALITPMDSDGNLNESALRKVIEFNISAGVHGFWVAGGSGESVLLDDEENCRIAQIVSQEARGRVKNIMHVGTPTTARSAKLAEHAAQSGVDAICCVPPFFYRQSDEAIVEHYRVVASASVLPFFVYNLPPVQIANAIVSEAALSFLGLGMPVTKPSLGSLINSGFEFIFSGSWWITIIPGIVLVVLVLVMNLLGDFLRDVMNPKLYKH